MVLTSGTHGPSLAPFEFLTLNVILIATCFVLLCQPKKSTKKDVLILVSITLAAAASRILLEPFPNVQPVTLMCLVVGACLGARRGMAFAIITTLLSNVVLSHGWWTLFQASGWAAVAFAGSRLNLIIDSKLEMRRIVVTSILASVLFDWWVSLSIYTSGMSLQDFGIYILNGLPFDVVHALASVVSAFWIGPWLANLITEDQLLSESQHFIGEADGISS
tara:strand:+ start:2844 stop:3503 length:660 start_codon:yes stop_codon:yes gene_type:complete